MNELEAGRELDALVAEKVMGNKDAKKHWDWEFTLPSYSTDISAAWQVVEKMGEFQLERDYMGNWQAIFFADDNPYFVNADTAPLAICRAALKAIGKDEG